MDAMTAIERWANLTKWSKIAPLTNATLEEQDKIMLSLTILVNFVDKKFSTNKLLFSGRMITELYKKYKYSINEKNCTKFLENVDKNYLENPYEIVEEFYEEMTRKQKMGDFKIE